METVDLSLLSGGRGCRCSGAIGADESFPDAEDGAEDSCCVVGLTSNLFSLPWFAPMARYGFRSGQLAQRKAANVRAITERTRV